MRLFDADNEKCKQCIKESKGAILFCEPIGICKYDSRTLRQAGLNCGAKMKYEEC